MCWRNLMKTIILVNIFMLCVILLSANNALEFNGSSSKIIVSDTQVEFPDLFIDLDNNSFTFEFWIQIYADTQNATRIIDIRHSAAEYIAIIYYSQKLCCNIRSPGYGISKKESNTISEDCWYYVILKWNCNTGQSELIINNEVQNTSNVEVSTGNDNHFLIGTKTSSGSYFHGKIDDFRIWSGIRAGYQLRDTFQEELTGNETDLYLYYPMDVIQPGSIIEDLTANDFDGDCVSLDDNDLKPADAWLDGFKCLQFDGVNDYVNIKYDTDLNSSNYSIILWFMADNFNADQYLFSKGSNGYYLKIDSNEQLDFNGFSTTCLSLDSHRWYNIAAVKDDTAHHLYLDGKELDITGSIAASQNYDPLFIGQRGSNFFTGKIDEIQIYNSALSYDELSDLLYSNFQDRGDLISWFDCNRYDGSILYDRKNNLQAYMKGIDSGAETDYSFTWIIDSEQSWFPNELTGKFLTIVDDDYFQTRRITSNTPTQIFVDDIFSPPLQYHGNLYCISDLVKSASNLRYPGNNSDYFQNGMASIWNDHPEAYSNGLSISADQLTTDTFLEIGNNDLTGISYDDLAAGAIDYRLARIWEIILEDDISTMEITFDVAAILGYSIGLGDAGNYQLLHSLSVDGDFTAVTTNLSASINESEVIFTGSALDNLSGYITLGVMNNAPLPATLSSFTGSWSGSRCCLNWMTLSETNNCGWNIYRGDNDGMQFQVNTQLISGAGTTTEISQYSFEDQYEYSTGTIYYYWLESVSLLGATELYGPILIETPSENEHESPPIPLNYGLSCYPNPFNPSTRICLCVPYSGFYNLAVYNLKGQIVQKFLRNEFLELDQQLFFAWDGINKSGRNSASGNYLLHLTGEHTNFCTKITLLR